MYDAVYECAHGFRVSEGHYEINMIFSYPCPFCMKEDYVRIDISDE
jgi:hypothetical protein